MKQPDETGHLSRYPFDPEALDSDGVPLTYQHWSAAAGGLFMFCANLVNLAGEDFPLTQAHVEEASGLFQENHPDLWGAHWAEGRRRDDSARHL